jgi:hypothetical protein
VHIFLTLTILNAVFLVATSHFACAQISLIGLYWQW